MGSCVSPRCIFPCRIQCRSRPPWHLQRLLASKGVWGWLGMKVTKDPSSFPEFTYGFALGWNFEESTFPETNREFTPEYWWLKDYNSLLGGFLVGVKCYVQEVQVLKAILLVYWWYVRVLVCFMTIWDCGLVSFIFHVYGIRTVVFFSNLGSWINIRPLQCSLWKIIHFSSFTWKLGMFGLYKTRWWFQTLSFIFTPIPGEIIQFDEHMFQTGWKHHLYWGWSSHF